MARPIKRTFKRCAILHTRISEEHKDLLNRIVLQRKVRTNSILISEADIIEHALECIAKTYHMAPWWNPE